MDMQNVAKLNIPEGDVRTIHDKDGNLIWGKVSYGVKYKGDTAQNGTPTPSAPVAVQTVTGENVVRISDGTNEQSYEVNLGDIELCELGDYQDYIWKDGDDWKVHKETGKALFEDMAFYAAQIGTTGHWRMWSKVLADIIVHTESTATTMAKTNVYVARSQAETYNKTIGFDVNSSGAVQIYDPDYDTNSADVFIADMTSQGAYIVYPLATPTDTEITNDALVAQLEAVEQWLTRYGYNATVTGNLPLIIDRTAL